MNDPFFDEGGGEFADYPSPSASSPEMKPKHRNKEAPAAQPATPGARLSTRSPAAPSSVVSRSFVRDRTGSSASNTTDLGKQDKRRKKHGKPRRKASQELFDVQWESDVMVAKCGLCKSDFSLVRRKHHCRHCGRVMCSDCSSFLYFEFSHRKHRVCTTCNNELLAEQEAYDRETLSGEGQERDTTSRLFEDSCGDERPSAVAVTATLSGDVDHNNSVNALDVLVSPTHNGFDEKARKKVEKRERKKREKLAKREVTPPVVKMDRISRRQVEEEENEAALFDGADDDWFTDVPDQNVRSRDNGGEHGEAGSKGRGWRDRVRDTYTISSATDQPSVIQPMAGSRLTAGITGKGYISDQFRYDDVGGPALGHDDDLSVEMPRPKQQPATRAYTDHSVKPSHLTGNGYFSEQFQYDGVGGPGLGHDDDHSVGMPRPKQQPVATPYSYDSSHTLSEHNTSPGDGGPPEHEVQPRLTLKDNLKDIFGTERRESFSKRKERKIKVSKPRARGNENMTLDELNPSYSSEDEPRLLAPAMLGPTANSTQPTFYENDADKFVVDDSPGFFEATIAEQEAQRRRKEDQQQQLASDMEWVNSSALPPNVPAHRFSSEQDSYSIVDHPSHTSNSPVEKQRVRSAGTNATGSNGNRKGGITGALKRFFGMGSRTAKATTPPKSAKMPPAAVTSPHKGSTEIHTVGVPESTHPDNSIPTEPASSGLARHTVVNYYETSREEPATQANFRNTVGAYADPKGGHSRLETSVPSEVGAASQTFDQIQQRPERKRRDTFDDLFESPKNDLAAGGAGRYSSAGVNGWTAAGGESSNTGRGSYHASAVGVSRFDHRRSMDETDEFTLGDEPKLSQPPTRLSNNSTETWRQSAAMSVLDDRKYASQSEESAFTWSNVRSVPGLVTATYAVPTSLQPRAAYDDNRDSSFQYDTSSAPLGSIMDDLKRGSTSNKSPAKESVNDFFAEFEEPNDYVFDPATGGYVAARVPPRAAVPRSVIRSVSTELQSPRVSNPAVAPNSSEREYYAPSEPLAGATSLTTVLREDEDVGGEVADIIVDKISSLEGELAALKQLIRNRKGNGGNNSQGYKPRVSHSSASPSVRKESIFDNDSSDEDSAKPSAPYTSSIHPAPKREGKRRPGSIKKHARKRKDSFADLFDDSPNEKETFGAATSYEALFQTGPKASGASKEDSGDDVEPTPKPIKTRAAKSIRRSSRKNIDLMANKDDSGSEPEFASLKGRRGKQSFRRKTNDGPDDIVVDSSRKSENQLVTPPAVDVVPASKPMKRKSEEEDPIDALFDSSDDRDVTKFYGGDDAHDREDKNFVLESQPDPLLKDKSVLSTHAFSTSFSDDEVSGNSFTVITSTQSVEPVGARTYSLDSQTPDDADEDEEFAINWTKMRKNKSRRHKPHRSPFAVTKPADESITTDGSTQDLVLDQSLLSVNHKESQVSAFSDVKGDQVTVPSILLPDTSSNWMSISTFRDETINLRLTGGEDLESLLQPVGGNKSVESTVEFALPGGNKRDDDQDTTPPPVLVDHHVPSEALSTSARANDATLSERDDASDDDQVLPKRSYSADSPKKSDAAFDIFDESSDVDFLSATLPVKTSSHADESAGSEGENEESLPDKEAFSFEIKASKKRVSGLDVTANIASASSAPEGRESSPPSPTSSEDNVEIGKYSVSSVPSSRTPSVDDSIENLEETPLDDESMLGKVESHAFDSDWNQMQAKEKERKKRLQAKQRQAQRDKVIRKQGASSRSLTGSSAANGSSIGKSKSGKKKKKNKDDAPSSSSHHKKSGSSRKHRHREKGDGNSAAPSEPPRSLTEL